MAKGMLAGFYNIQIAFRDSNGYPMGQETDPDNVSAGTITSVYRMPNSVDLTPPAPSSVIATNFGGQRIRGQVYLGVGDLGTGTMTVSEFDETFHAYVTGSSVDTTTASGISQTVDNTTTNSLPRFVMLADVLFDNSVSGATESLTFVFPNVQFRPQPTTLTQDGGVNPTPMTYEIIPSLSSNTGYGLTLANTSLNATNNQALYVMLRGSNAYTLTTFVDDGADTDITMGFLPTSSVVDGSINIFSSNGADDAADVSALSTSTGEATVVSGTSGDIRVFAYQTQFADIP